MKPTDEDGTAAAGREKKRHRGAHGVARRRNIRIGAYTAPRLWVCPLRVQCAHGAMATEDRYTPSSPSSYNGGTVLNLLRINLDTRSEEEEEEEREKRKRKKKRRIHFFFFHVPSLLPFSLGRS